MPFRIKDLTVDVTAANVGIACPLHTIVFCQAHCSYYWPTYHCHPCSIIISQCPYHSYVVCQVGTLVTPCGASNIPDPFDTNIVVQPPEVLKARLQEALKAVEAQERVVNESQKVQTVADAEMLEKKLIEALEEIRERRAELQKGAR